MDISITQINASLEITSRIWMQLCDFRHAIQLPEDRKQALFAWSIDLSRKLESVKCHRDNLLRAINEEFARRAEKKHSTNATFIEINTAAEKEFEAFLMQGKSTLDILVKMFIPLFGIKLHSYGDGGSKVSRMLQRNLNALQLSRAQDLVTLIEQDRSWIEKWFCGHRYRRPLQAYFVIGLRYSTN